MTPRNNCRIGLWGNSMPSHNINLDALIIREDLEAKESNSPIPDLAQGYLVSQFEKGQIFRSVLRKPDFQRETASWTPEKVCELVRCFLEGDLIPSVILWRDPGGGNIFVIDGAHRLSALIAWIQDDYGDNNDSQIFFDRDIAKEQIDAAEKTRTLIQKSVGTYSSMKDAAAQQKGISESKLRMAQTLGVRNINVQWVQGDVKKAEESFFGNYIHDSTDAQKGEFHGNLGGVS